MDGLTAALKEKALGEGFDLVGVAAAQPTSGAGRLRDWLAAGRHGDMSYMAATAHVRADPGRLLAGCRSVVAVAMSYRTGFPDSCLRGRPGEVWISRYAWGRDYHRVLKRMLIRVGRWLEDHRPGCGWRACVDTAPALEREWAARAGLGWIGKNTSLLNRRLGSELFLGLLLTDVVLRADGPVPEHCGRCTACLDACPTQAFPEARALDATRCVAYLTVEHHGEIPEGLRDGVGNMVAGCDVCQEVCPWTQRAPADLHPEFRPAAQRHRPLLEHLEDLDEARYRLWRQGSSLNRVSYAQFRRNLETVRRNLEE